MVGCRCCFSPSALWINQKDLSTSTFYLAEARPRDGLGHVSVTAMVGWGIEFMPGSDSEPGQAAAAVPRACRTRTGASNARSDSRDSDDQITELRRNLTSESFWNSSCTPGKSRSGPGSETDSEQATRSARLFPLAWHFQVGSRTWNTTCRSLATGSLSCTESLRVRAPGRPWTTELRMPVARGGRRLSAEFKFSELVILRLVVRVPSLAWDSRAQ